MIEITFHALKSNPIRQLALGISPHLYRSAVIRSYPANSSSSISFASIVRIVHQSRIVFAVLLCLFFHVAANAQYSSTDGATPQYLTPGAPAGAYALSEFESVNLFNGNLNFSLPLVAIGGRGGAGHTISLDIEQKWRTIQYGMRPIGDPQEWYPVGTWWGELKRGYGPGVLEGRRGGYLSFLTESDYCGTLGFQCFQQTLTRLTFTGAGGTEFELRDLQTDGQPALTTGLPCDAEFSRGTVFVTADGSAATFISDTTITDIKRMPFGPLPNQFKPSGILMLKDGTRYRIARGVVAEIRDRNGNRVSYTYENSENGRMTSTTDSLNRQITITYNNGAGYDLISYKGSNGAIREIKVWYANLGSLLVSGESIQTYKALFPELPRADSFTSFNPVKVSSVELPDHRTYQFRYNRYGELARVDLPTGGRYEYEWGSGSAPEDPTSSGSDGETAIIRRVTTRRIYRDSATLENKIIYNAPSAASGGDHVVTVEVKNANDVLLEKSAHTFHGKPYYPSVGGESISYPRTVLGRERQTDVYNIVNGSPVLKQRTINTWVNRAVMNWWTGDPALAPGKDPRLAETTTTLYDVDPSLVAKKAFTYDQYNNITEVSEYGFGVGAPGPLIRRTQTTYLTNNPHQGNVNYATDFGVHIRNLPIDVSVFDGNGTRVAQTGYVYDAYGAQEFLALVDRSNITQHDPAYHKGYGRRGNVSWVANAASLSPASYIYNHFQYDIAGNMVKKIDGRGVSTDFDFSDRFGSPGDEARSNAGALELAGGFSYAFPTKVTNALNHTAYTQYDYYLGKPVNVEDANGIVSSVAYDDALDRPTRSIQARYKADAGIPAERRQTTITYDDANRVITTRSDLTTFSDNALASKSYYDGLGRTWRSARDEGSTWAITDTRFDALGRVSQVSNPYRAADPDSASPPSGGWTKTVYDTLGRVVDVETPNGGHITTLYSGNQVTVADQAGKKRRSEIDASGRLIKVTEDPSGLKYDTLYSYDALGNLRQVTQGAQTRTFAYDSLSRLISATNPESGTVTYAYDSNSNPIEITDARGVRTTMTYDALNCVRSKIYAGTTEEGTAAANATTPVSYFYDDYSTLPSGAPRWPGTPSKGKLIGVAYGTGSEGTYYKYDAAGRIVTNHQRQGTANYVTGYTYNLAGAVIREDRGSPARRRNEMFYDEAGRLSRMETGPFSSGGIEFKRLVGEISYTPSGALQSEKYGNGLIHSMSYNNRLQLTKIGLGRPDNPESVFKLNYIYGAANDVNVQDEDIEGAANNGNIARIKYFIGEALQYSQTFQYDPLNRLGYAVEHNNGVYNDVSRAWYQTFDYDRYGNRGINVNNTSDNADAANSALKLADFSGANNRITRAGFVYDAAGNLIAEPGKSYTYDAENRLVTATVAGGVTSQYFYDGNGHRVKKVVGGVATMFVYGAGDELIEERGGPLGLVTKEYFYKGGKLLATTKEGGGYEYATADRLGSPRAWTDGDGSLNAGGRHDYFPFGEELSAGIGIRSASLGYGPDMVRQKFTGKERDAETGLDYFLARYYSNTQGRFTSPDEFKSGPHELWVLGSGDPENQALVYANINIPQSLNKYQYCFNNPLRYVDPDGQDPQDGGRGRAEERDVQALGEGRITLEEFKKRQQERVYYEGVGAVIGIGIVVAPRATMTFLAWMLRNPATVLRSAETAAQLLEGNPASFRAGTLTIAAKTRLTADEISTGARFAKQTGARLVESAHVGEEFVDVITRKTYDAIGGAVAFQRGKMNEIFDSILRHVRKSADYTIIDFQGATKDQIKAVKSYVSSLTQEQQARIKYLE